MCEDVWAWNVVGTNEKINNSTETFISISDK